MILLSRWSILLSSWGMVELWASGTPFETLCLATNQGLIYWPVNNELEKTVLLHCASRYGLCLDGKTRCASNAECPRGIVAGLGSVAKAAAQFYAYLTLRDYRFVDNAFEILNLKGLEVVVTTPDHLSPELFDVLQWVRPGLAPGLIFANEPDLRMRCMVCALAAHGSIQNPRYLEYFNAGLNVEAADEGNGASEHPPPADLQRIVSGDAGLLVLQIHCDGIDASLSSQTILCARPEESGPLTSHLCGRM